MSASESNQLTRIGRWGYAGPWYGGLTTQSEHPLLGRLAMLRRFGLEVFTVGLTDWDSLREQERKTIVDLLDAYGMQLAVHIGYPYITASDEEIRANNAHILLALSRLAMYRQPAIVTTEPRYSHRFDKRLPLDHALERLSKSIAPIAAGCRDLGVRLGIENHGDFYCSDLVQVCRETPDLYLFLDTGNTFLIGERPLEAFRTAAPYVIGAHFKDHKVRPRLDARPLHLEIGPSALGDGDVPLQACYDLLAEQAPYPYELIMEIEMICPDDESPIDCLNRSIAYIRTLDGEQG
ncbi:sugar phosphate isomerase/epimerase family protein [Paenibacillus sacheonensis]|uniref:TIM barrel protein n=1 Tax=Paenibacillus sacheonensis TaxID=742054 RepID=A0A7X4YNC9_9BACL|nr:sugar phosphate isomerase/epimerase family protein [Paenibacillus sacheonensis]MBM7565528.1 sugar phosphate isomerase/epimerase [Paenibacillus sacheonensis]NBC69551.1 TIM barrel protein [Paenibacillus sacheonensis]